MQQRVGVAARGAAVDAPSDAPVIVGLVIPARCGKGQQDARRSGHAAEARTGGRKYQPPHPVRRLVGELLRDDAAEGDAEHIDVFVAESVEHPFHRPCDAGHPSWPGVRG